VSTTDSPPAPGPDRSHSLRPLPFELVAIDLDGTEVSDEIDVVLKRGDSGPKVGNWQRIIMALGVPLPVFGADNDFGEETEAATMEVEKLIGLEEDGRVSVWQARIAMERVAQLLNGAGNAEPPPEPAAEPEITPPKIDLGAIIIGHLDAIEVAEKQIAHRREAIRQIASVQ